MEQIPKYEQVIACKKLSEEQLIKEYNKLTKYKKVKKIKGLFSLDYGSDR